MQIIVTVLYVRHVKSICGSVLFLFGILEIIYFLKFHKT